MVYSTTPDPKVFYTVVILARDDYYYRRSSLASINAEMLIFLNKSIPKVGSY
jgi:hypothetical protein